MTVPSEIKTSLKSCYTINEAVEIELNKINTFQSSLSSNLKQYDRVFNEVKVNVKNVQQLDHFVEYLRVLQDISDVRYVNEQLLIVKTKRPLFLLLSS